MILGRFLTLLNHSEQSEISGRFFEKKLRKKLLLPGGDGTSSSLRAEQSNPE